MKEEIIIEDKLIDELHQLYPERSLNALVNDSLRAYIEFLKVQRNYEVADKPYVENWGRSHFVQKED